MPPSCSQILHTRAPKKIVYRLDLEHEGEPYHVHMAVRRGDFRTVVVFAELPIPLGGAGGALRRAAVVNCALQTTVVDWSNERLVFGETHWLAQRNSRESRAIRRISVSRQDCLLTPWYFPPVLAEPLLRMLERSVPAPDVFPGSAKF